MTITNVTRYIFNSRSLVYKQSIACFACSAGDQKQHLLRWRQKQGEQTSPALTAPQASVCSPLVTSNIPHLFPTL